MIRKVPRVEHPEEQKTAQEGEDEDEADEDVEERKGGEGRQDGADGSDGRAGDGISNAMDEVVAQAERPGAGQPPQPREDGSHPRSSNPTDGLREDIAELRGTLGQLMTVVGQLGTAVRELVASRVSKSQSRKRDSASVVDVTPSKPVKRPAADAAQRGEPEPVAAPDGVPVAPAHEATAATPPATAPKGPRPAEAKAATPVATVESKKTPPEDFKPLVRARFLCLLDVSWSGWRHEAECAGDGTCRKVCCWCRVALGAGWPL